MLFDRVTSAMRLPEREARSGAGQQCSRCLPNGMLRKLMVPFVCPIRRIVTVLSPIATDPCSFRQTSTTPVLVVYSKPVDISSVFVGQSGGRPAGLHPHETQHARNG